MTGDAVDVRRRLQALSPALVRLHKTLLDDARQGYEGEYGPIASTGDLLRLLLQHEEFAWLRALSGLIARIDDALDAASDPDKAVPLQPLLDEARVLLRSGESGDFSPKYAATLQRSPDAVIAHAAVVKILTP